MRLEGAPLSTPFSNDDRLNKGDSSGEPFNLQQNSHYRARNSISFWSYNYSDFYINCFYF